MPSTQTRPTTNSHASVSIEQADLLDRIARRALAYCTHMIWEANHREDTEPGDPKVGGHPAACASSLHLATALHLAVRHPSDYYCAKPHLAPMDHAIHYLVGFMRHQDGRWMERDEMEAVMHRLRMYPEGGKPVFQSYHSEWDPDCWRILPSGTVGIPPVASAYLALAYDYALDHGYAIKGQKHFWSLIGDSEFREGSLMEALPDIAERELGNVTWIIDYNRQNLDGTRIPNPRGLHGTDADRIERTAHANGWDVIQIRHGRKREALFKLAGGKAFRDMLENGLSDYEYQALIWKRSAETIREELLERDGKLENFLKKVEDEELIEAFGDVGGHDMVKVIEALRAARANREVPVMIVAHTVKGWGLESYAAPGNHSSLPDRSEVERMLIDHGLSMEDPYGVEAGGWTAEGPEMQFLNERGQEMRQGLENSQARAAKNREIVKAKVEPTLPLPTDFGLNLDMVPYAHTQWAWGQIASKLVRVGTHDELTKAGQDAGKELNEKEQAWAEIADLILTMSPDVGTSTNINPAMDAKIYGRTGIDENLEADLDLKERGRPQLYATGNPWTRHIRFEIAEANCMTAVGSFGKMGHFTGVPFFPMMTVYDFFIKRALDQFYYNLYWGGSFLLVGTPSGVTLSPEGAQHSWKSDIQIPNMITWEPCFAREMEWIIADAVRRHIEDDHEDRSGVLLRAVTRGIRQKMLKERLQQQKRFQRDGQPWPESEIRAVVRAEVLEGGYRLVDYRGEPDYSPGENVVTLLAMGALVPEVVEASDRLKEVGIYADVIVVTSADLLLGRFARRNDYHHLRNTLGVDGALYLSPSAEEAARGAGLDPAEARMLAARTVPIVSVADGEEGLLDNAGSILGVKQITLGVHKFSKSGRPRDVYAHHGFGTEQIFKACGQALAQSTMRDVRLAPAALQSLSNPQGNDHAIRDWRELWPYEFESNR